MADPSDRPPESPVVERTLYDEVAYRSYPIPRADPDRREAGAQPSTAAPATKSFRLAQPSAPTPRAARPARRVETAAARPAPAPTGRANLVVSFEYDSD